MKQNPSRLKFKKNHKPNFSFSFLFDQKNFYPLNGFFYLKALESGKLTFKQLEAGRKSIRRSIKKYGNIFIRVFPNKSISKKSIGIRMGKGKGNHSKWICTIRRGQVIFELSGILDEIFLKRALKNAAVKLPIKTKIFRILF